MIKNEVQYQVSRKQLANFESALGRLRTRPEPHDQNQRVLHQLEEAALISQLNDLRAEVHDYEELRSGKRSVFVTDSFEELPRALIAARIASGMSQEELANRLGLKKQQIQRYEDTDYASASIRRVGEVARALSVGIREEVLLPSAQVSPQQLFQRLRRLGIDRNLIIRKLLPSDVRDRLEQAPNNGDSRANLALRIATVVGRIFNLDPVSILGQDALRLDRAVLGTTHFKVPAKANEHHVTAYAVYARYLAGLLLEATPDLERNPIPGDPRQLRADVVAAYGSFDLEHVLRYVWDLGVAVLPLNDPGAFHGACWRMAGRNVIVLKQRTRSAARWTMDLVHELRHAGQDPEEDELAVVEFGDTVQDRQVSPEERAAVRFAGDAMLDGRAEELAKRCANEAAGGVERLKAVVPRVAEQEGVAVDALANYMAFRLAWEKPPVNWWGAATNLQEPGPDPWRIARDVLLERADLGRLEPFDRELLARALAEPEE